MNQPINFEPSGGFSIVKVILSDVLPTSVYSLFNQDTREPWDWLPVPTEQDETPEAKEKP